MASVDTLRGGEYARLAYVLFIEGTGLGFTTDVDLAGSGASSWIGTGDGEWVILHGLEVPDRTVSLDWQTGMLDPESVTFKVLDEDGRLAALFISEPDDHDLERLGQHLDPTEDPAPATKLLYGGDGGETVDIRSRHIGTEYIDGSGNRRQFWIAPDHPNLSSMKAAPMDHPVVDHEADYAPSVLLPGIFASESAYVWAGRKVALYVVHYDHHSETWPEWRLQAEGGALAWYGTMRDQARLSGPREWQIECDGPHSWRQKLLNTHRPSKGFDQVRHLFSASDGTNNTLREDAIYVHTVVRKTDGTSKLYGARAFLDADDFAPTDNTAQAIRDHIIDVIDAAIAAGPTWVTEFGVEGSGAVGFLAGGVFGIQWKDASLDNQFGSVAVCMHRKYWAKIGFDLDVQGSLDPSDPAWLDVGTANEVSQLGAPVPSQYRIVRFNGTPILGVYDNNQPVDNNGAFREHKPVFGGELIELDPNAHQQIEIASSGNANPVYLEGQLALPPSEGYDATAFLAFVGRIQRPGDSEPRDYAQVAKVSYNLVNNRMATDSEERVLVRIDKWLDPRAYGFPYDRFKQPWLQVRGGVTAYALGVIGGYHGDAELDEVHMALGRLHHSSGTAGPWSSHDQDPLALITAGENHPTTAVGEDFHGGDIDIADLGLNLPPVFVDFASFREAADHLPGGAFGDGMAKCKVAMVGPAESREVIRELMRPVGLATSWKPHAVGSSQAPAFGAFAKFATLSQDEVEVEITPDDLHGNPENPISWFARQALRFAQPVDRWTLRLDRQLLEDRYNVEQRFQSTDNGVRHRRGDVHYRVNAPYARPAADKNSTSQISGRLRGAAARFYAGRHFPVTKVIGPTKAQQIGVGTVVRVTDSDVVDTTGTYGITNRLGRVIAKTTHPGEHATIKILVQANNPANVRHWAPMGRVYGWDESGGTYTLHLAGPSAHSAFWALGDAFEKDDGKSDALGFDEPDWSTTGGDAKVKILQSFDGGRTWGNAVTGTVTGSDTAAYTVDINSVSGTLYRDTDKLMVLQAYADQDGDSWTRSVYAVNTQSNGKHGASKGWKLQ